MQTTQQDLQTDKQMQQPRTNTLRKTHQKGFSMISAKIHISESEIVLVYPDYDSTWEQTSPAKFKDILHSLGLEVDHGYITQEAIQHRNRLGEQVTCARFYGDERLDDKWIRSGYASQAAKDKLINNRLLDESYRARYETEDTQAYLERRDMYNKIEKD